MIKVDIEELMQKIEEFKYEDFIELEPDITSSFDYEKGFDLGVGLCLTILDELRDQEKKHLI